MKSQNNKNYPKTNSEIFKWIKDNFAGRIIMASRTKKMLRNSQYEYTALLCDVIALLAHRQHKTIYDMGLKNLRLKDEKCTQQSHGKDYQVRFEGKKYKLDRHIKKGNDVNPQKCLRVYYHIMGNGQVLIGSLPEHLPNRSL